MKKATWVAAGMALVATAFSAMPAAAVPHDNRPKILLHVRPTTTKNQCTSWGSLSDCQTATTSGTLSGPTGPFYFIYVLGARGNLEGLTGVELGINYQDGADGGETDGTAIDIFGWSLCATLEFPQAPPNTPWPRPESGNAITWATCQTGVETSVCGYFYAGAYTSDKLDVTVRPVSGASKVTNCEATETVLTETDLGFVEFSSDGSLPGCNPCVAPPPACGIVPVRSTTWGSIKTLFPR